MKPVVGHLRSKGFLNVSYLDDLLLIGYDIEEFNRDNFIGTLTPVSSNPGWGSTFGEESPRGHWCYTDLYDMGRTRYINELGMMAIFNGLKIHTLDLTNVSIVCRTDSTTSPELNTLMHFAFHGQNIFMLFYRLHYWGEYLVR